MNTQSVEEQGLTWQFRSGEPHPSPLLALHGWSGTSPLVKPVNKPCNPILSEFVRECARLCAELVLDLPQEVMHFLETGKGQRKANAYTAQWVKDNSTFQYHSDWEGSVPNEGLTDQQYSANMCINNATRSLKNVSKRSIAKFAAFSAIHALDDIPLLRPQYHWNFLPDLKEYPSFRILEDNLTARLASQLVHLPDGSNARLKAARNLEKHSDPKRRKLVPLLLWRWKRTGEDLEALETARRDLAQPHGGKG